MANAVNWFEIPAANFERAVKFYSDIFQIEMPTNEMNGTMMGFFPGDGMKGEVSGAVCAGEWYQPSDSGTIVYLNGGDDLGNILSRVDGAGGKTVVPKTKITDEIGYFAIFVDSEGNRVALHSMG